MAKIGILMKALFYILVATSILACTPPSVTPDPTPVVCSGATSSIICYNGNQVQVDSIYWENSGISPFNIRVHSMTWDEQHFWLNFNCFLLSGDEPQVGLYHPESYGFVGPVTTPRAFQVKDNVWNLLAKMDTSQSNIFEITEYDTISNTLSGHYDGVFSKSYTGGTDYFPVEIVFDNIPFKP